MKKFLVLSAILAIAASCNENELTQIEVCSPTIYGYTGIDSTTKTSLTVEDDGVGTIWWKSADIINVFFNTTGAKYISTNSSDAKEAVFSTSNAISSSEISEKNRWGLYPYDASAVCDGHSITTTISSSQKAIPGTFDVDLFTMLAHSENNNLLFKNVCGGIKFSLSRDDIMSISFEGNNEENLAGKVKLTMDGNGEPCVDIINGEKTITIIPKDGNTFSKNTFYYLVLAPGILEKGFTMTFDAEDEIGILNYTSSLVEIKRSIFSKKEIIDTYAVFTRKEFKPLAFTSCEEQAVRLYNYGEPPKVQYSYDNCNWVDWDYNYIEFGTEEHPTLYLKGDNPHGFSSSDTYYSRFYFRNDESKVQCSGSIMNLISSTKTIHTIPSDYCFSNLFRYCKCLISAPELPATTITKGCYDNMFVGCTSLITAPELPATTLAESCYRYMFNGCTSLKIAPDILPATNLAYKCYYGMFYLCESLTSAPQLPATKMVDYCYFMMFSGCSSLVEAPELSATTLASQCYSEMFYNCTSLKKAPDLLANKLIYQCYYRMFNGCSSLNYIKCLAENPSDYYLESWVDGVSTSGIFVRTAGTYWIGGVSGQPSGWATKLGNSPEGVDLGLSVKWAECNLDASSPENSGGYYAWAALDTWYYGNPNRPSSWKRDGYCWYSTPFNNWGSIYNSSYWYSNRYKCVDVNDVLLPENDAANFMLGGNWRMPTKEEFQELLDNCYVSATILNGVNGWKLKSKKNNKSIFLPAAGEYNGTTRSNYGTIGNYWSSTLNDYRQSESYTFILTPSLTDVNSYARDDGNSIRPVLDDLN